MVMPELIQQGDTFPRPPGPSRAIKRGSSTLVGLTTAILVLVPVEVNAQAGGRDWSKDPAIVQLSTNSNVFALGDVHGDYDRLVAILHASGLIPEAPEKPEWVKWDGGGAILVCTGDLIDKGSHSLEVLLLFRALQIDARKFGGRVIVTMGNHEAEFLANPNDGGKAAAFLKELDARSIDPEEVAAGRDPLGVGKFMRSLPFAAKVNDWFFAHAGNTHGLTIGGLAFALRKGVEAEGFKASILLDPDSILEARLHPSPWWEIEGDPEASEQRLSNLAKSLGIQHFVIGHQPGKVVFSDGSRREKGELYQAYDGLVFLIDVGMSEAVDYSQGAILKIRASGSGKATVIFPDGSLEEIWSEQSGAAVSSPVR